MLQPETIYMDTIALVHREARIPNPVLGDISRLLYGPWKSTGIRIEGANSPLPGPLPAVTVQEECVPQKAALISPIKTSQSVTSMPTCYAVVANSSRTYETEKARAADYPLWAPSF